MAFLFPELIKRNTKLEDLNEFELKYWHEKMHIFWNKIESGVQIPEWDLNEVYIWHKKVIEIMKSRNIYHLSPINSLDIVKEK